VILDAYDTPDDGLLLPGTGRWGNAGAERPFSDAAYMARCRKAWEGDEERGIPALASLGFHEARHSFASWLVLAGYDVATISAWIGHAQASTTLDRYVKPLRDRGVSPEDVRAYLGVETL
jgi:integrase